MRLTNFLLSPPLPFSMPAITISSRENKAAFTLIELLMGIAILGVLAAITFGVFQGVKDSQNRARAKAELSVLSQALERFKSKYGDYPWTAVGSDPSNFDPADQMMVAKNNSARLLNALMGWGRFDITWRLSDFDPDMEGVALIDVSKFTVRKIDSDLDYVDYPLIRHEFHLVITLSIRWEIPTFIYMERLESFTLDNFSYILYSKGNDEVDSIVGLDIAFQGLRKVMTIIATMCKMLIIFMSENKMKQVKQYK